MRTIHVVFLFIWATGLLSAAICATSGVPWSYALPHCMTAAFIGASLSVMLLGLLGVAERAQVRRAVKS